MDCKTKYLVCKDVKTAYIEAGDGPDMILMHGWGQNKEMMMAILDHFCDRYHVYSIDFPGHGESDDPNEAWGVEDYMHHFESFVEQLHIEKPVLVGHSFGCRVAIRYAAVHHDVSKMCLTGAAGIKPKRKWDYYVRTYAYKAGKQFLKVTGQNEKLKQLQANSGSEDYRNAKGIMKPTFVKVVNDDVTPVLKDVLCPVLLVWGDQDTAAPLWMGQVMEKEMPNAGLAIFQGDDHWAYWHQAQRFNTVLDIFLKEEQA